MTHRSIIHLDLDAFYASVEQLRRPELRGKPVIVGGGADRDGVVQLSRGVVSTASYEARVYGVRSAMPLRTARRLCPQAIIVPVDFPAYREASHAVFAIARDYTPLLEPMSLDEAFLDVTGSLLRFGTAARIAADIRDRVRAECHLDVSLGVATCKTVAKIASDLKKPRGLVVVDPGEEARFLAPLTLRRLPGLGPSAERALNGLGLTTLGQLATLPLDVVQRRVGMAAGRSLWARAQGIDDSPVVEPGGPRSVSREETFASDVPDAAPLHTRIGELAADVGARLRAGHLTARTVTIKLRYADFTTITRQQTLASPTAADTAVRAAAHNLFDTSWSGEPVRLLGVGVSGLEEAPQLDLFEVPADERLDRTLDGLRSRFGSTAIRRGSGGELQDRDWRAEDLRP